jgi:diaminohydroxyphosphoribosylaminopyrimidine deaminase/5-amino-6-(5-phosphoribosylamino)uracil reductase
MEVQARYMQRALELAALGLGRVSPNPMVGCVLVHQGRVIGEGWHQKYGGPHAEVNAINSVVAKAQLKDCTLYVNLEPCSHHGKTPPCADLVITSGIKKVIISNQDPNPQVAGQGIARMREHGVEVQVGVLEEYGRFLNRRFFTFHRKRRPYIILKWAQTTDGYLARANGDSKWISNEYSRQLVHRYRASEDAIMVGRGTAQHDDPAITTRHWQGRNPLRVVLDPQLVLKNELKLFDGTAQTLRYNTIRNEIKPGFELVGVSENRILPDMWEDLYQRGIQSILVEGGAYTLKSLMEKNYWDEARVFTAPVTFGAGISAPTIPTSSQESRMISGDQLEIYYNGHASD